jgi:hypothetical protein
MNEAWEFHNEKFCPIPTSTEAKRIRYMNTSPDAVFSAGRRRRGFGRGSERIEEEELNSSKVSLRKLIPRLNRLCYPRKKRLATIRDGIARYLP